MENYTQVPNILIDEWMSKMKPASFTVLMTICRKTFGWRKESDSIGMSQIIKLTGLPKRTIFRCIKELEDKELIKVNRNNYINEYSVNITGDTEDTTKIKVVPHSHQIDATQSPVLPESSATQSPTKETIIKKTITKENNNVEDEIYKLILKGFNDYHNNQYVTPKKEFIIARNIAKRLEKIDNWQEVLQNKINGLYNKVKKDKNGFWSFTISKLQYGWNEFSDTKLKSIDQTDEIFRNLEQRGGI